MPITASRHTYLLEAKNERKSTKRGEPSLRQKQRAEGEPKNAREKYVLQHVKDQNKKRGILIRQRSKDEPGIDRARGRVVSYQTSQIMHHLQHMNQQLRQG
jgi:hypothetical protein